MPIRPVEIMEKHTYDPDKDGIIALAQLVAEVCNDTDTDTKVAAEAAARVVDVDTEESDRIADVNAEETARINALTTHTELPAAHHAKTIDASELTAGILALARLAGITNTQIAAGAAIVYTKLALAGLIRNTDIKSDAAIAESKLALAQGTQALFDKIAADIANHAGLPTVHQDTPALITAHGIGTKHRWTDEKLLKGAGAGANPDEIDVPVGFPSASAGDILETSDDPEVLGDSSVYAKVKEILIARAGTYRVKFDLKRTTGSGNPCYGKIYKGGVPVGSEQTNTTSSYVTKSEDIGAWTRGDLMQLYLKRTADPVTCNAENFRIYTGNPVLNSVMVV